MLTSALPERTVSPSATRMLDTVPPVANVRSRVPAVSTVPVAVTVSLTVPV